MPLFFSLPSQCGKNWKSFIRCRLIVFEYMSTRKWWWACIMNHCLLKQWIVKKWRGIKWLGRNSVCNRKHLKRKVNKWKDKVEPFSGTEQKTRKMCLMTKSNLQKVTTQLIVLWKYAVGPKLINLIKKIRTGKAESMLNFDRFLKW